MQSSEVDLHAGIGAEGDGMLEVFTGKKIQLSQTIGNRVSVLRILVNGFVLGDGQSDDARVRGQTVYNQEEVDALLDSAVTPLNNEVSVLKIRLDTIERFIDKMTKQ